MHNYSKQIQKCMYFKGSSKLHESWKLIYLLSLIAHNSYMYCNIIIVTY
jgi:hypothetical protein